MEGYKLGCGCCGGAGWMALQATFDEFGGVLRFEARIFFCCVDLLGGVGGELVTSLGVLSQNVPIMRLLFHFVLLVFDAELFLFAVLRFEAILGFACFGS